MPTAIALCPAALTVQSSTTCFNVPCVTRLISENYTHITYINTMPLVNIVG